MKTTEPHAGQAPREASNRATRAASLGLAAVVMSLAVFSVFAAYTVQTQVARVEHAESLDESYGRAIAAIRAEESAELQYLVDPSPERRAAINLAANALFNAVNEIEIHGSGADARLAKDVLTFHDQFVVASAKLTAAVERGDAVEARRIDEDEADPVFHAMQDLITAEKLAREAEADSALAALHDTAEVTLILAPLVFAVGFALLLVLWRVLEGYHRATRKTYREIEQLSRLRSEFVSIVSHEFRTPLTGIQGFSEMMRDEVLTMPEVQEYAGDINKDARRLARLITDMLDLDRMESGKMTLNSEDVDLNRVVGDAAAQFRLSAADHPIVLDLDELPPVRGDPDRLTQVVTNLLSNAIKYSPSGGAVELKTERTEKAVTFTVRDHGIGIPDDQLEAIFDRYARVQSTETRTIQGTGLGLPIVRQIVQLHGGTVWATSELGQGSVFHVQLPVLESASLASRAA